MTLRPIEASEKAPTISPEHKEEVEVFLNSVPNYLSLNTQDSLDTLRQLALNWKSDPLLDQFCQNILDSISKKSVSPNLEASRIEILNKLLS